MSKTTKPAATSGTATAATSGPKHTATRAKGTARRAPKTAKGTGTANTTPAAAKGPKHAATSDPKHAAKDGFPKASKADVINAAGIEAFAATLTRKEQAAATTGAADATTPAAPPVPPRYLTAADYFTDLADAATAHIEAARDYGEARADALKAARAKGVTSEQADIAIVANANVNIADANLAATADTLAALLTAHPAANIHQACHKFATAVEAVEIEAHNHHPRRETLCTAAEHCRLERLALTGVVDGSKVEMPPHARLSKAYVKERLAEPADKEGFRDNIKGRFPGETITVPVTMTYAQHAWLLERAYHFRAHLETTILASALSYQNGWGISEPESVLREFGGDLEKWGRNGEIPNEPANVAKLILQEEAETAALLAGQMQDEGEND
jgi:hypothetical protein